MNRLSLYFFLLIQILIIKVQSYTICANDKEPLYILNKKSLNNGHGQQSYIPVCSEDINKKHTTIAEQKKIKLNRRESSTKDEEEEEEEENESRYRINGDEKHHFENDDNNQNYEVIDWSSTIIPQQLNMGNLNSTTTTGKDEDRTVLSPESAFKIELSCQDTPNVCKKVKQTIERSTRKIALALKIYNPIIVRANFYNFCKVKGGKYCSNTSSIGSAAASAYHILNRNGTRYLYPQPLVKQMNEVDMFLSTDITADFNSEYSFYFSGDNEITTGQVDFEYVVLHEFLHGLGFATSFQKFFSSVVKVVNDQDFLTPGLSLINDTYVSNWRPIQIFDKNIIVTATNTTFENYNNQISGFAPSKLNITPLDYHNEFINSLGPYQAAKNVLQYSMEDSGSLIFQTLNGKKITLYTKSKEFLQGTSIAHLDDDYMNTSDFIMISDVSPFQGKTLASIYNQYGENHPYGAIGPNVLSVLNEIGWEIADIPNNISLYYVETVVSSAVTQKFDSHYLFTLIFGIIITLFISLITIY